MVDTKDACKVWFNPERGWYQLYDKDGKEIPLTLDASVTIEDNFSKNMSNTKIIAGNLTDDIENLKFAPPLAALKIELIVQIVNEEPKYKIDNN